MLLKIMRKNKKLSHPILFFFLKNLVRPIAYFKWGYRYKDKYKIKKGEKVVVVSNHQTDLDPILIHLSINKLARCLATDNIFAGKFTARLLRMLGAIPKRKGMVDLRSNMEMLKASNNGDSLLFFPEGNRSYAEFQYFISDRIGRLLKSYQSTLILFNIHGGFGRYPRIGSKPRKGRFYGEIKKVLPYNEYKDMDDSKLSKLIIDNIKVIDAESGDKYLSKNKAEYFERLFFICPKCGELQSIYSVGDHLKCHHCDLDIEYGEDLKLHSHNEEIKFEKLLDWYNYQIDVLKQKEFAKGEEIFKDEDVSLKLSNPFEKVIRLSKHSKMILTSEELIFDNHKFDIKDIKVASPVSGRKLCFTIGDNNYVVRGNKRFNAIKYVFIFHKLDTLMKKENIDNYYRLEKVV